MIDKEQIESVIEDMLSRGYTPDSKTVKDNRISLQYGGCEFTLNIENNQLVVDAYISIDYHTLFDQEDVDWLNSVTNHWKIYKNSLTFSFTPNDEKELETTLLDAIQSYW